MAQDIQRILIKYEADIKELRKDLDGAKKELREVESTATKGGSKITSVFKGVATGIAAAFSVQQVIAFGKELNQLQREAQGVRQAFDAAFDPGALKRLRDTTKGTLSDLDLMKRALAAREFGIGPDLLAKGLEFARVQANKLGLEFNQLANDFVTGTGRKSIQILDNLGISQADLSVKVKETGDFYEALGLIIDEKLGQDGAASIETLADRQNRLNAQLSNLRLELSDALLPTFEKLTKLAGQAVANIGRIVEFGFGVSPEQVAAVEKNSTILAGSYVNAFQKELDEGLIDEDELKARLADQINRVSGSVNTIRAELAKAGPVPTLAGQIGINNDYIESLERLRKKLLAQKTDLGALGQAYAAFGFNQLELKEKTDEAGDAVEALAFDIDELFEILDRQELTDAAAIIAEPIEAGAIRGSDALDDLEQKIIEYAKVRNERLKQANEEATADDITFRDTALDTASSLASGLIQIYAAVSNARRQQIQDDLENGRISQEEATRQLRAQANRDLALAGFEILSNQATALAKAISSGAKTPILIPGIIAGILASFAQVIALQQQAKSSLDGFAVGTSGAPGGMAWVGEEGPEIMHVPRGARVFTATASKKEKNLIDAINDGSADDYIRRSYVDPALTGFAKNLAQSAQWQYDDFFLRQDVKGLKRGIELGPKTLRVLSSTSIKRYH
jgi:hypothetical protein